MSEIVEKVAKAFGSVTWQENKTVGDYRNEVARAAIKATLEHLRDNPSDSVQVQGGLKAEAMMFEGDPDYTGVIFRDMGVVFAAMISQALLELEES